MINAESTRHPDWIPVKPGDGAIRKGDRYRVEYTDGYVGEDVAQHDHTRHDFHPDPDASYYVWSRPEPKPYEAIPEGRENAALVSLSIEGREPIVGIYWRDGAAIRATLPTRLNYFACQSEHVTSAVPVTAVPTDALNELREAREGRFNVSTYAAVDRLLAAVDGAGA